MTSTLAIFDLDHTLLTGDSDVLWCQFLVAQGLLPPDQLALNARMEADYRSGTVSAPAFSLFYVSTLGGRSPAFCAPWRQRFLQQEVLPRIPAAAHALVASHRTAGHTLVMSTATNRVITELTAAALDIPHLIATEAALAAGLYTGRTQGVLNMREGKVQRLHAWLADRGLDDAARVQALAGAHFYSDSANDLPLLRAVGHPTAVDPDDRLLAEAQARGWPVLRLNRSA
ncbi:MAG: HAD-IB family hydrolase [Burkholderiaceae bacterium]|nr:HAD-IB family hydrolase [Burkholderiaceae bacterium]